MQSPSFAIGIPTINRADLLNEALEKYAKDFPDVEIFILDNGRQLINFPPSLRINYYPSIYFNSTGANLGVAGSWNLLIQMILKRYKYAVILNDDIYWGKDQEQVQSFLNRHGDFFVSKEKGMCAFITTPRVHKKVGYFDENFYPAYFEDNDIEYRLKLAGIDIHQTNFLDPVVFRNSESCKKDPSLNQPYLKMRDYYVAKWGGKPGEEKYLVSQVK